ncbi:MAG: hypothetical protein QG671_482 [Actinomycetota bacterium]|nr:hypothetical protein [Actinomycetota bacterium]
MTAETPDPTAAAAVPATPPEQGAAGPSILRGAGIVAISLGLVQVFGYLLNVAGARLLTQSEFGALASLLNLVIIGNVVAFGLQAVAARLVVTSATPERDAVGARILRFGVSAGALLAVVGLLSSPIIGSLLHQSGAFVVACVALMLAPLTVAGGQYGLAQGREQHLRLGTLLIVTGVGRLLGGLVGLLAFGTVTGTIALMCLGTWLGATVGMLIVRRIATGPPVVIKDLRWQVIHASHAMFALFVATSVDLLLARFYLTGPESGAYAVGAIVTKIAFWLPAFIAVVAFPRMADDRRQQTTAIAAGAVAAIGAVLVLALALMPGLVIAVVAGDEYTSLAPDLWIFGLIGAAFSLAQFLLYSRLAVDDRRAVFALWAAVVFIFAGVSVWHASVAQVATVVAVVALALSAVGVASLIMDRRHGVPHPGEGLDSLERA